MLVLRRRILLDKSLQQKPPSTFQILTRIVTAICSVCDPWVIPAALLQHDTAVSVQQLARQC